MKRHFFSRATLFKRLLAGCAVAFQFAANAGTVTIGFDDLGLISDNRQDFVSHQVLFSTSCHYHNSDLVEWGPPSPYGKYLGWDQSGCYDDPNPSIGNYYNKGYLGPTGWEPSIAKMFVALEFGNAFTIQSLVFASQSGGGAYKVTSSKGGVRVVDSSEGNFALKSFAGDEWADVTWLEFVRMGGSDVPFGFDNLTLASNALPEPSSAALAILAVAAAGAASKRRRR